jgi:hypothetical protein
VMRQAPAVRQAPMRQPVNRAPVQQRRPQPM